MDEDFSDLSGLLILPDNHIRSVQTNMQAQLESFRKTEPDANFIETYDVCENVKEKILNHEDESQLSKIHNNSRKISIASELCIGICSIYSCIVDCEFTKIIDGLIQWKKYEYISKKITHKMKLELKREKYFEKEAQSKLHKSAEDGTLEGLKEMLKPIEEAKIAAEGAVTQEKKSPDKEEELRGVETAGLTHTDDVNMVSEVISDTGDEISKMIGDITVVRAESPTAPSLLQLPHAHVEEEMHSSVTFVPEIPIGEVSWEEKTEDDINKILRILEGEIIEKEIDQVPESLVETTAAVGEPAEDITAEELLTHKEDEQMDQLEEFEEWELPDIELSKKSKKKHSHLIIDKTITIHNYSERALYMNSNIKIERVQVFEGPPRVLQAMSASHLMKTSGYRSSFFQDVRSSKLNKAFERHLKVEKKPAESITAPQTRTLEQLRKIGFSKIRAIEEVEEDVEVRAGMHSLPRQGNVFSQVEKERSHFEEISTTKAVEKERFTGMPMSRIISPTAAAPPDLGRINAVSVAHTPRAQQLQGQSLDREMHSSWFYSTEKNPPNAKYREFNYVRTKLQECWSLLESQGMKKSVTLREFFNFEADGNVANFLTVLRVLDKLAIQRQLLLKYQEQDVLIQPFETPFVSEKQLGIKEEVPVL